MQQCITYGKVLRKFNTFEFQINLSITSMTRMHHVKQICSVNKRYTYVSPMTYTYLHAKEHGANLHKRSLRLFILCNKHIMRVVCDDQVTSMLIDTCF